MLTQLSYIAHGWFRQERLPHLSLPRNLASYTSWSKSNQHEGDDKGLSHLAFSVLDPIITTRLSYHTRTQSCSRTTELIPTGRRSVQHILINNKISSQNQITLQVHQCLWKQGCRNRIPTSPRNTIRQLSKNGPWSCLLPWTRLWYSDELKYRRQILNQHDGPRKSQATCFSRCIQCQRLT
jgi:hypothetical protein